MANSKYEYVRSFEYPDSMLPNTWMVIRLDGRGFHKLSAKYNWEKPNDKRALDLMNAAAQGVMTEIPDIILGYGVSDEFSFVFHKDCTMFQRRASKLVSTVVSTFTSYYVYLWTKYFTGQELTAPMPSFDGRAVAYPSIRNLRDYLCWRQADCHINNLYNTTFWLLVLRAGMSTTDAEQRLSETISSDKNEILFSQFGINYNNEPQIFRKGTVIFRDYEIEAASNDSNSLITSSTQLDETGQPTELSKTAVAKEKKLRSRVGLAVEHIDIIRDEFWDSRPWILNGHAGRLRG